MPALPPVAKVVRVDFHHTLTGNANIQNRVFFQYAGALSQADAVTFAALCRNQWILHTMLHLVNLLTLTSTVVTDLTSASAPQAADSGTGAGGSANPGLSEGAAVVIKKILARRYRGGHPRDYLAGPTTADLAAASLKTWSAASLTNWATDYQAFVTAVVAGAPAGMGAVSHVSVSYFQGFTNVTNPITGRARAVARLRAAPVVDPVLSVVANPKIASQRRRNQQST
jgi:hypothetical protein